LAGSGLDGVGGDLVCTFGVTGVQIGDVAVKFDNMILEAFDVRAK